MKEHNKTLRLLRKIRRKYGDKVYKILSDRLIHTYLNEMINELNATNQLLEMVKGDKKRTKKVIEDFFREFREPPHPF